MSLRIRSAGPGDDRRALPTLGKDDYLDRLVKLMPVEAVAAYPFLHTRALEVAKACVGQATDACKGYALVNWLPAAIAWLLLALVIVLRWQATRDARGHAQWGAVLIAAISFLLWVPAYDGGTLAGDIPGAFGLTQLLSQMQKIHWSPEVQSFIPQVLLVLWTILVPQFYRPAGESSAKG